MRDKISVKFDPKRRPCAPFRNDRPFPSKRATEASLNSSRKRESEHPHPTTGDPEYTEREHEFMFAMQLYKKESGRMFPTWSEVLRVIDRLGYVKLVSAKVQDAA